MQSLGEILSSARNEKGYSVDQVAHDTNISKNYLQYLENEEFDQFPAEAYLIGFLRNYSDYLGLETEKLIALYRNHKISEEPTPIEELVGKKKSSLQPLVYLGVIGAIGLIVFLGIKILPKVQNNIQENRQLQQEANDRRQNQDYKIDQSNTELRIMQGDGISFEENGLNFMFTVEDSGDFITLVQNENAMGESTEYNLHLKDELYLSLFRDSPDYRLFLQDMALASGESLLFVEKLAPQEEMERSDQDIPTLSELETELTPGETNLELDSKTILTMTSPERFTLDIRFRGYALYRYEVDNRDRDERYYREGDNFRLDVNRSVTIWLSNGVAAYAKINGVEVNLGGPGEVVVKTIQWTRNDQGSYDLVLIPIY